MSKKERCNRETSINRNDAEKGNLGYIIYQGRKYVVSHLGTLYLDDGEERLYLDINLNSQPEFQEFVTNKIKGLTEQAADYERRAETGGTTKKGIKQASQIRSQLKQFQNIYLPVPGENHKGIISKIDEI